MNGSDGLAQYAAYPDLFLGSSEAYPVNTGGTWQDQSGGGKQDATVQSPGWFMPQSTGQYGDWKDPETGEWRNYIDLSPSARPYDWWQKPTTTTQQQTNQTWTAPPTQSTQSNAAPGSVTSDTMPIVKIDPATGKPVTGYEATTSAAVPPQQQQPQQQPQQQQAKAEPYKLPDVWSNYDLKASPPSQQMMTITNMPSQTPAQSSPFSAHPTLVAAAEQAISYGQNPYTWLRQMFPGANVAQISHSVYAAARGGVTE